MMLIKLLFLLILLTSCANSEKIESEKPLSTEINSDTNRLALALNDGNALIIEIAADSNIIYDYNDKTNQLFFKNKESGEALSEGVTLDYQDGLNFLNDVKSQSDNEEIFADDFNAYRVNGHLYIGYLENESDMFKADTAYAAVLFEDLDLSFILASYVDKDTFTKIMQITTFKVGYPEDILNIEE